MRLTDILELRAVHARVRCSLIFDFSLFSTFSVDSCGGVLWIYVEEGKIEEERSEVFVCGTD